MSRTPQPHASGFTLIELMIAIGLGVVLCYTAFASIRVAMQSTALTNRLSTENTILRIALQDSMDELDFWTAYDDPNSTDPLKQKLRAPGRPFNQVNFNKLEFQLDFTHSDPRTWWRGAIHGHMDKYLGDYSLFSRTNHELFERRWYGTMMRDLYAQLGSYAVVDYLPGNAIYSYSDDGGSTPACITNVKWGPGTFYGKWYADNRPRGQISLLHNMGYCVTTNDTYLADNVHQAVFSGWAPYSGNPADQRWSDGNLWGDAVASDMTFMNVKPEHIPNVTIKLAHFYDFGPRPYGLAYITMSSPVTAKVTTLQLAMTATTLRGARRQRGLDVGTYAP
jgi:prepilin-type N-terminal cleavage/methylation domain-containing protein